jgi:hypothetical protein
MPKRSRSPATGATGIRNPFRAYRPMLLWSLAALVFASFLVWIHSVQSPNGLTVATFGLLLAFSAFVVGALTGFLFGIPRALQQRDDATSVEVAERYAVNTNLEQISDWLTKILVGVGLVQLTQVPKGFGQLSNMLAPGLGGTSSSPMIAGLVMTLFASLGFFLGYLLTRTYLTVAFKEFDTVTSEDVRSALEKLQAGLSDAQHDPARDVAPLRPPPGDDIPPTHNREPLEEPLSLPEGYDIGDLVALRNQAVGLLRQLLGSARSGRSMSPHEMVRVLVRRGVLDGPAASALDELFEIADEIDTGVVLPGRATYTVKRSGAAALEQLSLLGRTAAARFEEHVLAVLRSEAPANWVVRNNVKVGSGGLDSRGINVSDDLAKARVDAVVVSRENGTDVAVEVRGRLNKSDYAQLRALELWIEALPEHVPILLVVPNGRSGSQRLRKVLDHSVRRVNVLSWDDEADQLIPAIQKLQQTR